MARRRMHSPPPPGIRCALTKESKSDDEDANTESQQLIAIGSLLTKPKTDEKDMHQFRARVGADRKRLTALLDERRRQAEDAGTRRRNEIASLIQNALKTPSRPAQGEMPTYTGTKIARNATYAPVADSLAASEGLIREYERLDNISKDMQNEGPQPMIETWSQELAEMERQLRMGARVALRNVKKVLGAEVEDDGRDGDGDENMWSTKGEQELNYELQKSLGYAERGVKRMVKGLSGDAD